MSIECKIEVLRKEYSGIPGIMRGEIDVITGFSSDALKDYIRNFKHLLSVGNWKSKLEYAQQLYFLHTGHVEPIQD